MEGGGLFDKKKTHPSFSRTRVESFREMILVNHTKANNLFSFAYYVCFVHPNSNVYFIALTEHVFSSAERLGIIKLNFEKLRKTGRINLENPLMVEIPSFFIQKIHY